MKQFKSTIGLVDAEVYAHHYACRTMLQQNYFLVLGFYLDGLKEMLASSSEYIRRAANQVLESPDYATYENAMLQHQQKMANLNVK